LAAPEPLHRTLSAETSQGSSEYGIPLMTAQEIMQMGDEEILAFHSNLPPIKARRMDWRDFPVLQDRRRKPPLELPALPAVEEMLPLGPTPKAGQGTAQFVNPDLIH
jgi:type IV secretory pathway TraG/TraD family ATPase VirD4